jgi:hypothetical protein
MQSNSLFVKLFIGCLQTSELKMHLNKSKGWKEAKLLQSDMTEVQQDESLYMGYLLDTSSLSCQELRQLEKKIREQIQFYCPKINTEKLKICLFPQVFLA